MKLLLPYSAAFTQKMRHPGYILQASTWQTEL